MLNILGVGGHAKVVIETSKLAGHIIDGLFDDEIKKHNSVFCGIEVKGAILSTIKGSAIIAIGNNKIRQQICSRIFNIHWQTIIHPKAYISDDVEIGEGSVIMAGAILQPGTKIGRHCIVNTGACIDHDCLIGDFVHVGPNCSLAGGIAIGEGSFIGIGTTIIPYKNIGKWTKIGAGSVLIHDIPDFCTAIGVPAKPIKFQNE